MKLKAIIVDDEPLARDIVRKFLSGNENIEVTAECADGFDALKAIRETKPDLVFLDIQMPKIDGFELLEVLEEKPGIIFTTAYDQFAIKAFEMNAVDYLLKPFSKERFDAAVNKAVSRVNAKVTAPGANVDRLQQHYDASRGTIDRVVTRLGSKVTVTAVDKIRYIESQDDYVMIYSESGSHLKEKTMKYFEEHLPSDTFVRIHRSYIINLSQIAAIEPYSKDTHLITLKCGAKLKASSEGYKKLRAML
ncbi:MAG TPA: response regulator [Bacteroidales bacterium]|nr:response regulator [Bacteroidales bacterium]HPT02861.1 response regulator [Bacteroidales bacterium]